jgi:hypothetical protein
MPASLLDSQLQQLDVQDASELYMCFGCPQVTQSQSETTASCAHLDADQLASANGDTCTDEIRTAASENTAAASKICETDPEFPSTEQIVAAIVARGGCD